jgi:hypothetical protein
MAFIAEYEKTLTGEARGRGALDGAICGHIHHAVIRDDLELRYINCGDWVAARRRAGFTRLAERFIAGPGGHARRAQGGAASKTRAIRLQPHVLESAVRASGG